MSDTITYSVPGIHCAHCARAIREEVIAVEGVESVDVDLPPEVVTVRSRALSAGDVREAIAGAGVRGGVTTTTTPRTHVRLSLEGMTCAACATRIERKLNRARRRRRGGQLRHRAGERRVRPEPGGRRRPDPRRRGRRLRRQRRRRARRGRERARTGSARLVVAAALSVPLALLAMVPPLQFDGWEWLALALATPVVWWAGWPFHRAAALNARHGAATMDTLISIGTLAAWTWSVVGARRARRRAHVLRGRAP